MDNMSYLSSEEEDGDEDEDDTEESTCESDDDSSSQQTANMFTPHSDRAEEVCLGSERLTLPQGLCENPAIFNEFFSLDTWNNVLSNEQREHLKQFLPSFPQNEEKEQEETINNLFSRSNFKFGNPLNKLYSDLHNGYLRPDIAKMRSLMKRTQYREYRYWHRRYCYKNMQSLLVSRRRLMKAALSNPPDVAPKVERVVLPPTLSQTEQRARRRYFEELVVIRKSQGESSQSSEDENYPEGPPPKLSKKQKKQLSTMETCLSPDLPPIPSTLTSTASPFQLEAQVTCTFNPYEITEDSYKTLLMRHKKRRLMGEEHPDLNVKGITLQDVAQRSQTSRRTPNKQPGSQSDSQPRAKKKIKVEPGSTPPPASISFNTDRHNSPSLCSEDSCSIGFSEMPDMNMDVLDKPATPTRVPVTQRRKSTNSVSILPPPTLHIKEEALDEDDLLAMSLPQQQQSLVQLKPFTKQLPSSPQQPNLKFQQIQKPIQQPPKAIPQKPSQSTQKPLQQTSKPIQSIQKPVQQIQKPIQQIQKPLQQIQKPLQQIQKSLQQQQQQLHQAIQVQQQQQSPVVQLKVEEKVKEMPKQTPMLVSRAQTVMVSSAALTTTNTQSFRPLSAVDIITKVTANSLLDLNRTIKLEEPPVPAIKAELELTQETHVCFLSLVRDVICSTPDQRMGLPALEQKLRAWQESPISPLNDWYSLAPSWVALLPSAVNFLSGDFPAETQPEDFVPYLEYKPHMQAYQWIGAGRDSDHHLAPLCTHWLERRNEVPTVPVRDEEQVEEPGLASPPPARCPTTWQVRKAEGTERENFHQQEKRRYETPHRAFTYRMHGYESIVGPVKGACTLGTGLTKPRGHTLLVPDRPNYVTILSLVRDAVARLPNGEGSRSDICELLRDSQYLVAGSEENYLQSVVGGALDRLHFEVDTCVKYDAKRKTWVYLHRNRSEEEFEKLHQQQSVQPKSKRTPQPRKTATNRGRGGREKEIKHLQVVATTALLPSSRLPETTSLPTASPTHPSAVAPVKAAPVSTAVPRTFTLSGGLQNLQVATSSGIQTIQVSGASTVVGGTSLLTTSAGQTVKLSAAASKKAASNLAALQQAGLTPQALAAARLMVSSSGAITMSKAVTTVAQQAAAAQSLQAKQSQAGAILLQSSGQTVTTASATTTSTPLVLHSVASQARNTTATTSAMVSKALLAGVNAAQLVNMSQVSQMQIMNAARVMQQQQQQQQATETQQQKQAQKQAQRQQQLQKKRQLQQIQLQLQQQQQKQIQQQKQQLLEQQLQQLQDQQQQGIVTTGTHTLATGMKLINAQAAVKSLGGAGGAQAIFIKHSGLGTMSSVSTASTTTTCSSTSNSSEVAALQQAGLASATTSGALLMSKATAAALQASTSQAGAALVVGSGIQAAACTTTATTMMAGRPHSALVTTASGKPMVAKVLTNAQGQLISMEHLLAHQKQQLAAAGAVRVAGAKPHQASLIQIPGTGGVPQFAMVAPSGLVGPRLLQAAAQQLSQQQQQQVAQQAQCKQVAAATGLRMVSQVGATTAVSAATAAGLNVATIGGQPVILASKAQGAMAGQNVFLASSGGGSPAVVLASPAGLRTTQGGTLLLQPGSAQQIMLPHGFQGGTLNLKSLQGLQGIRVIPLSQASAAAAAAAAASANTSLPKGRQQVFARIISPPNRSSAPLQTTSTPSSSTEGGGTPSGTDGSQ